MTHVPAPLKKGDTIAITCPSGFLDIEKIQNAVIAFEEWGLKVIIGDTVDFGSDNYFSAPDELKILELQKFLDDKKVKAIFMGRGGYGMSRIIDDLDFTHFAEHPKWICGFSDITLLHLHVQNIGFVSLHSPMCSTFNLENEEIKCENVKYLKAAIMEGSPLEYNYHMQGRNSCDGSAQGRLLGGNLAMLTHAIGSPSFPNFNDAILFIEDIGEHIYKIDRMLYQLRRAGVFCQLKGVIVGQFSDVEDTTRPFGQSYEDVIFSHFKDLNIPVAFEFQSGHEDLNLSLKLGQIHELDVYYPLVKLKEVCN